MPLPSLTTTPKSANFCQYASDVLQHKGIAIVPPNTEEPWMQRGWQSLRRAERFELLRMAFRRLIELRCVIDSVLFLEEHHYQCQLTQFCPPTMTPRNLMLVAQRQ